MSAIWGIVDLSVAQSEAQKKKIVQGTCGKRLCGCGRPIGRAAWTGYRKKGEATYYLACRGTECHKGSCGRKIPL